MGKQFDNLGQGSKNMGGLPGLLGGNQEQQPIEPQEPKKTKSINFSDIPVHVHRFLKLKATDEGTSMAALILEAVIKHYGIDDPDK